jgi:hypothetical protein
MDIQLATNTTVAPRNNVAGVAAAAAPAGGMRGRGGPMRRGGFTRGRGRGGRGGQTTRAPAKTQAELDADLDSYTKMQTD